MPSIQKPALRDLYNQLVGEARTNPSLRVDSVVLDRIVAIVGDGRVGGRNRTSDAVAQELKSKNHTPEQKLALAQQGLSSDEKKDIQALLADPFFAKLLDPAAKNFLGAIVGLEALKGLDHLGETGETRAVADPSAPEVQAANKLRELVKKGELTRWYDAVIGAVDNPQLKAEAEALFAKLPTVKPGMAPDDFVKAGLWTMAPRGVEEMQKSARYLPGRQVLVETKVFAKVPARSAANYEAERRKIGTYDPHGKPAVTYRATLVGEDPQNKNNFLVKIDGADKPVSVTKASIYRHNQPHELSKGHISSSTKRDLPYNSESWHIDYASPLAKAKLCEIAIKMDDYVSQLDFAKTKTTTDGRLAVIARGGTGKKMVELQKKSVEIIFRSIDMEYPRDDGRPFNHPGRVPDGLRDAARQAIRGTGMCVQQSSVFGALLMPFMDVLGIDGQYRSGNCFRNIRGATENVFAPDYSTGHGWWQITFRPSMEMTVTDRTWNNVNLTLDLAYGFPYGDRYANTQISGYVPKDVTSTDVNVSGEVTVETVDRQFSQVGHGRENHISQRNRRPRRG
jgi:hypothetical protein